MLDFRLRQPRGGNAIYLLENLVVHSVGNHCIVGRVRIRLFPNARAIGRVSTLGVRANAT